MLSISEIKSAILAAKRENAKGRKFRLVVLGDGLRIEKEDDRLPPLSPGTYNVQFSSVPEDGGESERIVHVESPCVIPPEKKEEPRAAAPASAPAVDTTALVMLENVKAFYASQLEAQKTLTTTLISMMKDNEDRLDRRLRSMAAALRADSVPAGVPSDGNIIETLKPLIPILAHMLGGGGNGNGGQLPAQVSTDGTDDEAAQ